MTHLSTSIVGNRFRPQECQARLSELTPEDELFLEREPSNRYDPNALKVVCDGLHLGYIPKEHAAALAPLMDSGVAVSVRLGAVPPTVVLEWEDKR